MGQIKNEVGNRYGRLVVLEQTIKSGIKNKATYWKCQCDCGNTTIAAGTLLRRGNIKSCGCLAKETLDAFHKSRIPEDLSGNKYGRLYVLGRAEDWVGHGTRWHCLCECGNFTTVDRYPLTRGIIVSCGCYRLEQVIKAVTTHGLSKTKEYNQYKLRKRRQLKKQQDSEWTLEQERLLKEYFPFCAVCGISEEEHKNTFNKSLCVDHIIPLSKGGHLKPGLVVLLCEKCNTKKNNKTLDKLPHKVFRHLLKVMNGFYFYHLAHVLGRDKEMWRLYEPVRYNITEIWSEDV